MPVNTGCCARGCCRNGTAPATIQAIFSGISLCSGCVFSAALGGWIKLVSGVLDGPYCLSLISSTTNPPFVNPACTWELILPSPLTVNSYTNNTCTAFSFTWSINKLQIVLSRSISSGGDLSGLQIRAFSSAGGAQMCIFQHVEGGSTSVSAYCDAGTYNNDFDAGTTPCGSNVALGYNAGTGGTVTLIPNGC